MLCRWIRTTSALEKCISEDDVRLCYERVGASQTLSLADVISVGAVLLGVVLQMVDVMLFFTVREIGL